MLQITSNTIRAYIAERQDASASNASINRELAIVKRAFRLAEMMPPSLPKLKENSARRGFFERAQFDAVVAHLPAALQPVAEFAYLTVPPLRLERDPHSIETGRALSDCAVLVQDARAHNVCTASAANQPASAIAAPFCGPTSLRRP